MAFKVTIERSYPSFPSEGVDSGVCEIKYSATHEKLHDALSDAYLGVIRFEGAEKNLLLDSCCAVIRGVEYWGSENWQESGWPEQKQVLRAAILALGHIRDSVDREDAGWAWYAKHIQAAEELIAENDEYLRKYGREEGDETKASEEVL